MGGPSPESYRAAEAARRKRLAAMRTRRGVVDLAEWRAAAEVARCIAGLLHEPPWLLGVCAVPAKDVGFEIRVTILRDDPLVRMCLPTRVNDITVRVVARNPGRGTAGEAS